MNKNKKYKLLSVEKVSFPWEGWPDKKMRRIQALRDIPEHGVKAGDLGGYVSNGNILSQSDSCWIDKDAVVFGHVEVLGNVYIGDNALVVNAPSDFKIRITENVAITGNAKVFTTHTPTQSSHVELLKYSGSVSFSGDCSIESLKNASGRAKVSGKALLNQCQEITDDVEIYDNASLSEGVKVLGKTTISGNVKVGKDAIIRNSILADDVKVFSYSNVFEQKMDSNGTVDIVDGVPSANKAVVHDAIEPINVVSSSPALEIFREIQESIASYETDIVKLIKYPAMVDKSVPETLAMTMALKKARRCSKTPDSQDFRAAVDDLDEKFTVAESNAIKIVSTILSDEEKKKTEKAKDLLAIAANEGSSENEKKVSFKQAFKQLEGVIAVPEVAVDTFRVKIGLQELEM